MTPNQLKQIRKKNKLTQLKLANLLGLSRQATISDKETGKTNITKRDEKLIKALLPLK